jgi:hypothetical protein
MGAPQHVPWFVRPFDWYYIVEESKHTCPEQGHEWRATGDQQHLICLWCGRLADRQELRER